MSKKYTQTNDGWIQVTEDDEESVEDLIKQIDMLVGNTDKNDLQSTRKLPAINTSDLNNSTYNKAEKISDKDVREKPVKQKTKTETSKRQEKTRKKKRRREIADWERDANRSALWCLLFTFGTVGLIFGVLALCVWLGPLTWQGIAESIVVFILKILWWAYETFYNACVYVFEWILAQL